MCLHPRWLIVLHILDLHPIAPKWGIADIIVYLKGYLFDSVRRIANHLIPFPHHTRR